MVAGQYQSKPELPFVPGVEISGEILHAPEKSGFEQGQRVSALLDSGGLTRGGYAEIADAAPLAVQPLPGGMPFDEAAAFTLIFQTAWFGLHRRAALKPEETLLVHAGAGGVGSAAIQLGKAAGATVIATAGTDEKVEVCKRLGATHAINYKTQDFAEEVKRLTNGAAQTSSSTPSAATSTTARPSASPSRVASSSSVSHRGAWLRLQPTTCWSRTTRRSGCTGVSIRGVRLSSSPRRPGRSSTCTKRAR